MALQAYRFKFKPLSTGLQNLAVIYLSSVIFIFQFSKSITTNTFYIISYPCLSFEHTPAHHLLFHSSFKAAKYSGKGPAFKFRSRSTRFLILISSPLLKSLMIWSKYFTRPVSLPRRRHITCGTFTRLLWGLSIMVLNYLAPHLRHGRNLMVTTEPSFFPPPSSSILSFPKFPQHFVYTTMYITPWALIYCRILIIYVCVWLFH